MAAIILVAVEQRRGDAELRRREGFEKWTFATSSRFRKNYTLLGRQSARTSSSRRCPHAVRDLEYDLDVRSFERTARRTRPRGPGRCSWARHSACRFGPINQQLLGLYAVVEKAPISHKQCANPIMSFAKEMLPEYL